MDSEATNSGASGGVKRKAETQLTLDMEAGTSNVTSMKRKVVSPQAEYVRDIDVNLRDQNQRLDHGDDERSENAEPDEDSKSDDEGSESDDDQGEDWSEDFSQKERDVEEYQVTVPGSPTHLVSLKLFTTTDPEFKDWLQTLHITCTHDGKLIGRGIGQHIHRSQIRTFFYRNMEEPSQDMSSLAFDVFDRYGFLKKQFKDHPILKGTGKWGTELDIGILFLIESISLDVDWRRKGLGTIMAKALMSKAAGLKGGVDFTLAIPGYLNSSDLDAQLKGKSKSAVTVICAHHHDTSVAFFRSLGFRRIGASRCLGLAKDPAHKAHSISSMNDFDPEEIPQDMENGSGGEDSDKDNPFTHKQRLEEKRMKMMQGSRPVHYAVNSLPDTQCVEFLKARLSAISIADPQWTKLDHLRNNALHIAACLSMSLTCRWLMECVDKDKTLRCGRNIHGFTPVEALQAKLESSRISSCHGMMTVCISDHFSGYPTPSVTCLGVLLELPGLSSDCALRLKYGCTCGECLLGFMSPRMKLALLSEAEMTHDMLYSDVMEDFWCEWNEHNTTYVAPALKQNFRTNKSLRRGFTNMFDHIASCLRKNLIPTELNVIEAWRNASEWPPVTQTFLEKGGKIDSVLGAIFDNARDQDYKAGDGAFMEIFATEVLKLPECRNDHEFGFVALACGFIETPPPGIVDRMFHEMLARLGNAG